jgi:excisionase family DNA binding protein
VATEKDHRPPLDVSGAANYLGVSERFLRRLVQERRVPFLRVGGTRIRFDPRDLDVWLASQRVEAVR